MMFEAQIRSGAGLPRTAPAGENLNQRSGGKK
jgi:hypothetical protein